MAASSKPSKLVTSSKYALGAALQARNSSQKLSGSTRINIVSPKLCDDVLQRLSPSLKRHEHCDIVDIHPGAGLWSSKLHDHIKPRSHILVEPDEKHYLSFLEPLLAQPDSKYRLAPAPTPGPGWASYERVFAEDVLPFQNRLMASGSAVSNDALLLVANMAYYPRKMSHGFGTSAQWLLHRFFATMKERTFFHTYGLIRMLLWVSDDEKTPILPRTIVSRTKFTVQTEMCSSTEEVAGADGAAGLQRRKLAVDLDSARRVAKTMEDRNIETLDERKGVLHRRVTDAAGKHNLTALAGNAPSDIFISNVSRNWHDELSELEKGFREGAFKEFVNSPRLHQRTTTTTTGDKVIKAKSSQAKPPKTPQWKRMHRLQLTLRANQKEEAKVERLSIEQADIDTYEMRLEDPRLGEDERSTTREELNKMIQPMQAKLEGAKKGVAVKVASYSDERRAFQQAPPILMWDRRTTEPLVVRDDEFFPQQPMALLDVQPKPAEMNTYFTLIVTSLFKHPTQSVQEGLDSLAPGAADALIPEIPALRSRVDPG
ncbi:MAG: hypothetical protein M1830_010421, partial [Pleopsidium flavum]